MTFDFELGKPFQPVDNGRILVPHQVLLVHEKLDEQYVLSSDLICLG
jgi:hypothetical protein